MGKRVCLVLGLVVGLLTPAAPVAGVAGFGDVEPERYYTEPVQWMVDDHIVETDNSACFAPNIAANRGDTALYIWRMRGQPDAPPHPFEDVIDEDQNKAVSWMYANKITTGKTRPLSRQMTPSHAAKSPLSCIALQESPTPPVTPLLMSQPPGNNNRSPGCSAVA